MKISKTYGAVIVAAFAAASSFAALAAPAATPAPPAAAVAPGAKAPLATILFLDRATVLRQSAVGKDMSVQVQGLVKKMEAEFAPENKKLQADIQTLQSQAQIMDANVRAQRIKDIEARRQAFQKKVQDRQAQIQAGLAQARQKVEKALGPILEKMMVERGANLLLDRSLVVLGQTELDVTTSVITRLNTALPKVAVALATPAARPAGAPGSPAAPPKPPAPAAPGH